MIDVILQLPCYLCNPRSSVLSIVSCAEVWRSPVLLEVIWRQKTWRNFKVCSHLGSPSYGELFVVCCHIFLFTQLWAVFSGCLRYSTLRNFVLQQHERIILTVSSLSVYKKCLPSTFKIFDCVVLNHNLMLQLQQLSA